VSLPDDLRRLLPVRAFRRLLALRLLSQTADGIVSVALASYLFFSPERQTTPGGIAAVTAAVLLPFTVVGPFTGLVLDRWSRRDVLVGATVARALLALALAGVLATGARDAVLYAVVVAGFGVNRFVLAGLSAALPHTVDARSLLDANAVVPTAGTLAYVAGIGLGGVAQARLDDPDLVLVAVACWAGGALVGLGFARPDLGPERDRRPATEPAPAAHAVRATLDGLRDAGGHLAARPAAAWAIGVVAAQRLGTTLTLSAGILLYRSSYASADDPEAGLGRLSVSVLAAGLGFVLAAAVAPLLVERWSSRAAVTAGLLAGALGQAVFATTLAEAALVAAAFLLSLGGQVVKICADTRVQRTVDDRVRGRVFLIYDMAFNTAVVAATALGALLLPPSGRAPEVMGAVAVALAALAWLTARARAWPDPR
jgi:MFS family permease